MTDTEPSWVDKPIVDLMRMADKFLQFSDVSKMRSAYRTAFGSIVVSTVAGPVHVTGEEMFETRVFDVSAPPQDGLYVEWSRSDELQLPRKHMMPQIAQVTHCRIAEQVINMLADAERARGV